MSTSYTQQAKATHDIYITIGVNTGEISTASGVGKHSQEFAWETTLGTYGWSNQYTITAGDTVTITMYGSLDDIFLTKQDFTTCLYIMIENQNAEPTDVIHVKPDVTNPFDSWIGGTGDRWIVLRGGYIANKTGGGTLILACSTGDTTGYEAAATDKLVLYNPGYNDVIVNIALIGG